MRKQSCQRGSGTPSGGGGGGGPLLQKLKGAAKAWGGATLTYLCRQPALCPRCTRASKRLLTENSSLRLKKSACLRGSLRILSLRSGGGGGGEDAGLGPCSQPWGTLEGCGASGPPGGSRVRPGPGLTRKGGAWLVSPQPPRKLRPQLFGESGPRPQQWVGVLSGPPEARATWHVAPLLPPPAPTLQGPHPDPGRPGLPGRRLHPPPRGREPALPLPSSGSRAAGAALLPSVLPVGPAGPGVAVGTRCSRSGLRGAPAGTADSRRGPPTPPSFPPAAGPGRRVPAARSRTRDPGALTCAEQPRQQRAGRHGADTGRRAGGRGRRARAASRAAPPSAAARAPDASPPAGPEVSPRADRFALGPGSGRCPPPAPACALRVAARGPRGAPALEPHIRPGSMEAQGGRGGPDDSGRAGRGTVLTSGQASTTSRCPKAL